jgi:hypothetical protein
MSCHPDLAITIWTESTETLDLPHRLLSPNSKLHIMGLPAPEICSAASFLGADMHFRGRGQTDVVDFRIAITEIDKRNDMLLAREIGGQLRLEIG